MRVKMLTDAPGSPDGVTVHQYNEGEVYEVTDALGEAFLKYDLAEPVEESPVEPASEPDAKQDTGPQENK